MVETKKVKNPFVRTLYKGLFEAFVIAAAGFVIGGVANLFHPNKIPFIAEAEYETMVPCPVPGGDVNEMDIKNMSNQHNFFVVDARSEQEYEQWHYPDAILMTYDYLDPIPQQKMNALTAAIAKARATKVVVYGDGDVPDSGNLLGKDISGNGIKNVHFIKGGAAALRAVPTKGGAK